jgi:hypothetical protein
LKTLPDREQKPKTRRTPPAQAMRCWARYERQPMRAVDAIVCTSGLSMSTGACWAGSNGRPDGHYGRPYGLVRGTQRTRSNECKAYHREDRDITRHQDQANCRRDDGRERRAMKPSPKKGKESLDQDAKKGTPKIPKKRYTLGRETKPLW